MLFTLPWHSNLTLTILNIYAPNVHSESQAFWESLDLEWIRQGLPPPDIMLGDFNIVEDAIDRLPSHTDPQSVVTSLDSLRSKFRLQDGVQLIQTLNASPFFKREQGHNLELTAFTLLLIL
jgi:hypothetical protein